MKIGSILYVEDEDTVRKELSFFLERFCITLYTAADGEEGLASYKIYNPDIVITDIKMPKMSGINMAKAIKKIDMQQSVIFTTAHSESGYTLEAIDMQVDGYILKPVILKKLQIKLESIAKQINLKKEFIKQQNQLHLMAFNDSLTGIYNRQRFNEELQREIKRFKRVKEPLSLVMLDIDKFKDLNDTYGHQMGDKVLKEIASLVSKHIREVDIFARWGGEEFVILLPNTSKKNALLVAEHIRKRIENFSCDDNIKITASFGVTDVNDKDILETIEKRVDDALYLAKKNGRNRVEG